MDSKLPNSVDKGISSRIRTRRRELKLSQGMLAERLGVTFQQIQKYESGRNRVSAGRLFDLAKALNTTIEYLYGGASPATAALSRGMARGVAEEGAEFGAPVDQEVVDLVAAFEAIQDPKQRKSILAMVKKAAAASRKSKGDTRGDPGAN